MQIKTILNRVQKFKSFVCGAVRAQEVKELQEQGLDAVLTKTRRLLLKRPENLMDKQETRLADLLRYNLR